MARQYSHLDDVPPRALAGASPAFSVITDSTTPEALPQTHTKSSQYCLMNTAVMPGTALGRLRVCVQSALACNRAHVPGLGKLLGDGPKP